MAAVVAVDRARESRAGRVHREEAVAVAVAGRAGSSTGACSVLPQPCVSEVAVRAGKQSERTGRLAVLEGAEDIHTSMRSCGLVVACVVVVEQQLLGQPDLAEREKYLVQPGVLEMTTAVR